MDGVRASQRYFAGKGDAYRQSASHADRSELERMIALLAARRGERALDVATGGGHTALALQEAGCETVATDATPEMLRGWPPLPRAVCDAQRLPFARATFDIVTSRIAPHHFEDLAAFVRESARVLRPGGRFYVFDLTMPEDERAQRVIDRIERLRDPSHARSHPPSAWRAALAGTPLRLEALETRASEFDLEPWVARARMAPEAQRELRDVLASNPPGALGGYGLTPEGRMRVLRVELLARL